MGRMTNGPRLTGRLLLASVALALGACAMPAGQYQPPPAAAVGRVEGIENNHGYIIAVFPTGRMNISMDKREIEHYRIGDEIRIDSFGRPLR